jgi:hypothetical protein
VRSAARFAARFVDRCLLGEHGVRAGRGGGLGLRDRAALMDPRVRREPARDAPERDDRVGIRRGLGIARSHEGQQEVDGDWPAGQPACGGDLGRDRRAYARDRAETPGLRHSRGELVPRDAPHPRLNDRRLAAAQIEGRRHGRAAP